MISFRQWIALWAVAIAIFAPAEGVAAAEPVAVISEIRRGTGEILIKRVGQGAVASAQPLQALRAGDEIVVTRDAQAVIVFAAGRAPETLTLAGSPLTIAPPVVEAAPDRVRAVLASAARVLLGQPRPVTYQPLAIRSPNPPRPLIVSPRETKLLGQPVTFEWNGPGSLRYGVKVVGPSGVMWSQADLLPQVLTYPDSAKPLSPGSRYTWELEAPGYATQRATFEMVEPSEAARVKADLDLLRPSTLPGYPRTTLALIRGALLFEQGFYANARSELLVAIADEPNQVGLHTMLGRVYERMGLQALASDEVDKAQSLLRRLPDVNRSE